jgi:uncharacterized protein involved in exopolysaccharide biosynthesis
MENLGLTHYNGSSSYNGFSSHSPTLRDYLSIAFRHRRVVVLSFLGVTFGALVTALLLPDKYSAEMTILVKRDRVDAIVTPQAAVAMPQFTVEVTEADLNSEVELLKGAESLEKTVLACGLQHQKKDPAWTNWLRSLNVWTPAATPDELEKVRVAKAVVRLGKDLKVDVLKKTNLISVTYGSPDRQLSALVLNTLATIYLEKHATVHRPPGAFDFFQAQSKRYSDGLSHAETRLIDFNRGAAVYSAPLEKTVAIQKLAEFDGSLRQTEAAVAEAQQRIRVLTQEAASIPNRMITQVRNTDDAALLSQFRSNLLTLEQKRTELLGKFDPSYRLVQDVDAQIAQARAALASAEKSLLHEETTDRNPAYEWVGEELSKARAELAGLQARAKSMAAAVRSYQDIARSLDQKEVAQGDLIRTIKSNEENYLLYLRKQEEERISDALDRGRILNVAVAQAASVPILPSNYRFLIAFWGVPLAAFISLGSAFGSEYLASTFRTPHEVESLLGIPVLAAVPKPQENGEASVVWVR